MLEILSAYLRSSGRHTVPFGLDVDGGLLVVCGIHLFQKYNGAIQRGGILPLFHTAIIRIVVPIEVIMRQCLEQNRLAPGVLSFSITSMQPSMSFSCSVFGPYLPGGGR